MEFKLPSGKIGYIDKKDCWLLEKYSWHEGKGYVQTEVGNRKEGTRKIIKLHRLILQPEPHEITDHINRNGLDNRRNNLRLADKSTNGMNRTAQRNSKSGLKGISWSKQKNKWRITATTLGKQYFLGYAKTLKNAREIYNSKIKNYHKEFAIKC